jgi:hypothetical protein
MRQILLGGHRGAAHQHGDHPQLGAAGRLDLLADEVRGIVQPPAPIGTGHLEPAGADHHQEGIGIGDRALDRSCEVRAGLDRLDVHEHGVGAEASQQVVG